MRLPPTYVLLALYMQVGIFGGCSDDPSSGYCDETSPCSAGQVCDFTRQTCVDKLSSAKSGPDAGSGEQQPDAAPLPDTAADSTAQPQVFDDSGTQDPPPNLVINSISPPQGSASVEPDIVVRLAFSEAVDPASVTTTSVRLLRGRSPVPGSLAVQGSGVTFTPRFPLTLGAKYTLQLGGSLQSLPGGILGLDKQVSFSTREASWGEAERVDVTGEGDTLRGSDVPADGIPYAGIDARGRITIAWLGDDSGNVQIWVRQHSVTDGWTEPLVLGSDAFAYPTTAVGASGHAAVVWIGPTEDEDAPHLLVRRYDPAQGWTETSQVDTPASAPSAANANPRVVVDAQGRTTIVWGAKNKVWAAAADQGSGFSAAAEIANSRWRSRTNRLAVSPGGEIIACWTADSMETWVSRYSKNLGWQSFQLSTLTWVEDPGCGVSDAGSAVALWRRAPGLNGQARSVVARDHQLSSSWTDSWSDLLNIDGQNVGSSSQQSFVLNPAGQGFGVWRNGVEDPNLLRFSFWKGPGPESWVTRTAVSTRKIEDLKAGIDHLGRGLVVYSEGRKPRVLHIAPDGSMVTGPDLDSEGASLDLHQQPQGVAVAAWFRSGGVWVRRYF